MTSPEEMIQRFYSIRKTDFGFLERLELKQSVDPAHWAGFELAIDLRSSVSNTSPRLRLAFLAVQELRIGTLEGLLRYVIEIQWIGASQMEGIHFKVVEGEYNAISFVCDTFTASIE